MALDVILHRKRSSWWEQFQQAPIAVLAQMLYAQRQRFAARTISQTPKLGLTAVCISDTHNSQPKLPPGDLLLHAGDLTQGGTAQELQAQLDWINAQPHTHKIIIAGNHDLTLDQEISAQLGVECFNRQSLRWGSIVYLEQSSVDLSFPDGVRLSIFGHPATRKHGNWAFQYDKNTDAFSHRIEDNIDILVTHSPPKFHLDVAGWGDEYLLRELWRVKPRLHIFGHTHEGYGQDRLIYDRFEYLYELVRRGDGGSILALLEMLLLVLQLLLQIRSDRMVKQTLLVNASIVGGLLDEDQQKVQVIRL